MDQSQSGSRAASLVRQSLYLSLVNIALGVLLLVSVIHLVQVHDENAEWYFIAVAVVTVVVNVSTFAYRRRLRRHMAILRARDDAPATTDPARSRFLKRWFLAVFLVTFVVATVLLLVFVVLPLI